MAHDLFLRLTQNRRVRNLILRNEIASEITARYIAGAGVSDAMEVAETLNGHGLDGLLALVGDDSPDEDQAEEHLRIYLDLISVVTAPNEVAVTPVLLGLRSGLSQARRRVREVVIAAAAADVPVTFDMGPYRLVDATIQLYRELRPEHPRLGIGLQAGLKRTPFDLTRLAVTGARIRLVPGAYAAPLGDSYRRGQSADLAYVQCLRKLMRSPAYPMVATHNRRLLPIAEDLALRTGRTPDDYEFQMLYGFRYIEQRRLVDTGHRCRIYIPFGPHWYDYVTRRLSSDPIRWIRAIRSRQ